MHVQAKRTDICQTCIHVTDCAHYKNCHSQGKTIFHCENFDDRPALRVADVECRDDQKLRVEPAKTGISYIKGRMKGLCLNCENRETCKYSISDAGVWHCDEYC